MTLKRFLPLFAMLLLAGFSQAQTAKKIAPFQILLTNSQPYAATQLAAGAAILIYFSPDCEHCQNFTKDMIKNFSVVGNKQVVMITPQSMEMLKPFAAKYNLASYPNIKVGTEGTSRLVQRYYNIMHYPFIALYDKKGNLIKTFEGEQPHADIFKAMKSM